MEGSIYTGFDAIHDEWRRSQNKKLREIEDELFDLYWDLTSTMDYLEDLALREQIESLEKEAAQLRLHLTAAGGESAGESSNSGGK